MQQEIYLDNSATTKPYEEVIAYMQHIYENAYGNPSSLHSKGLEAEKLVKKARKSVADALKAEDREVIFTSGGTESNNLAIQGALAGNPRLGRHIITTGIEHPSVLETVKNLTSKGYEADFVKVDSRGVLDLENLKAAIRQDTALISIILVNNESGTLQPIEPLVNLKNNVKREILLHVDGVQAFGKIDINPGRTGIDLLSVSAHKIHGPKGTGALYVNKKVRIKPILFGGGQESLLRSGTENVPGIGGFGLAVECIFQNLDQNFQLVRQLKERFLSLLSMKLEDYEVLSPEDALPYILNITFPGVKAEVLLHHLAERNIFVSTGAACSSRKNIRSHVLTAMGIAPAKIDGAIRISFSAGNQPEDMDKTVEALSEIVPKIRVRKK